MSSGSKTHTVNMTEGPIFKSSILFSIPIILQGVLQLLYNAADIIVVGRFSGPESLAAVGSNSALINLLVGFFINFTVGASAVISQKFGERDNKSISNASHTMVLLGMIVGIILSIFGFCMAPTFLKAMSCPDNVINKASTYLKIYFIGVPGIILYNCGTAILRSVGDSKRPLYISMVSGVINVVFNLIFVIIFKLDVAGVGIATSLSMYFSGFAVMMLLLKDEAPYRIFIKKLKIQKKECIDMLKLGIPAGLQTIIFNTSNVLIQSSVNSFGSTVLAANSAAANIEGFLYMAMNSFSATTMTMVGQNYGAQNFKRIRKSITYNYTLIIILWAIMASLFLVFGKSLLSIYVSDENVINTGMIRMKIIISTYFMCGIMDSCVGALRALGSSLIPMINSFIGSFVFRILWIYTAFAHFRSLKILYLSYPISWMIILPLQLICFEVLFRSKKKKAQMLNVI